MDGTLVDSSAVVESMWSSFARDYGMSERFDEIMAYSPGRTGLDTIRRFLPELAAEEQDAIHKRLAREEITLKTEKPDYPGHLIQYRYYGHFIVGMIRKVCEMEMGPERSAAEYFVAMQMKRDYMTWNQETVEDIKIFKDLFELSDGQILLTPENCKLNINPNTIDKPGKLQKPINSKKVKKK